MIKRFLPILVLLWFTVPSFAQDDETSSDESTKKGLSAHFYVGGGMDCIYDAGPWDNFCFDAGAFLNDVNIEVGYGIGSKTPVAEVEWGDGDIRSYRITSSLSGHFGVRAFSWRCVDAIVRIGAVHTNVAVNDTKGQLLETTSYTTSRLGAKVDIKPFPMVAFTLEPEYVIPLTKQILVEEIETVTGFDKLQQGIGLRATVNFCF